MTQLTPNEERLLLIRQGISGRAWDEARWIDGRQVIVTGPGGNLLATEALVMPATAKTRRLGDPPSSAEALEMPWEEVAFRLSGGNKVFGPGTGIRPGPGR